MSKLKRNEERLGGYVQKFNDLRNLFDDLPIGIILLFDRDATLLAANNAVSELVGSPLDDLIDKKAADIFADRCPVLPDVVDQTLKTKSSVINYTIEVSGDPNATYLVNSSFIDDADGKQEIVLLLNDITETTHLERISRITQRHGELLGSSKAMRDLRKNVENCAGYDVSVVLIGETGTGKELAARSIHRRGARAEAPFVPVNCGAIPRELVESQLFGHVKGAFTSAVSERKGRFRQADGGTLFLDEVSTLPAEAQVKLLRALAEQVIEPVGSDKPVPVDVRVIAASNEDLAELIEKGTFREDLYYRLKVVQIDLPPLRDRKQDIPTLTDYFLARANHAHGAHALGLAPRAKVALQEYHWPGNVRELENAVEHALVMSEGPLIDYEDLPPEITDTYDSRLTEGEMEEPERLREALRTAEGNRSLAAELLDMHRTTLWRKMREHGIDKNFGKP